MNPFSLFLTLVVLTLTAGTVTASEALRVERSSSSPDVFARQQEIQIKIKAPAPDLHGNQTSADNASTTPPATDQPRTSAPEAEASVFSPRSETPVVSSPDRPQTGSDAADKSTAKTRGDLGAAWQSLEQGRLNAADKQFRRWSQSSKQALAREARLGLAYTLAAQGDAVQARNLLTALAKSGYRTSETASVALDLSLATGDFPLAKELVLLLPLPEQGAAKTRVDLAEVQARITDAPRGSIQERDALEALLRIAPHDAPVRERLAWLLLEQKDASSAADQFLTLLTVVPEHGDYTRGLALALQAQGKIEEALSALGDAPRPEWNALARSLHLQAAQRLAQDGSHSAALTHLEKAARFEPLQRDEQEFLIWTLLAAGQTDQAVAQSASLYHEFVDKAATVLHLDVLQAAGSAVQLQRLEQALAASLDMSVRAVLAERIAARGELRSAASANPQPTVCYANCDQPDINLGITMRHKDGDKGLSRLDHLSTPVEIRYPLAGGNMIRVGAAMHRLDTGTAPQNPYMGKYFKMLDGRKGDRSNVERQTVWTPYATFSSEKGCGLNLELGTTPLNAVVDPMPVFKIAYQEKGNYRISVHQCSVQDSMLSFVGQRDPYSHGLWGRVLRSGLELEKTFDLEDAYWLTFRGGADYYWGHNVEDNVSVTGTASLGKTLSWLEHWETNIGIFTTVEHFHRNSDFQTYGHGGYFSPNLFVMAGPFVRMTSQLCRHWFVDAEASIGFMHYRTASAAKYVNADASGVTSLDALDEWQGSFAGETKSGLGVSGRLQALHMLTDWTALGGFAAINTSTDHNQWETGLLFRIFFDPRNGLCDAQSPGPKVCR